MRDSNNLPINRGLLDELDDYFSMPATLHRDALNLSHHIKLNRDFWGFTLWNEKEVGYLSPTHIIEQNGKLLAENYNDLINGLHTTVRPKKFESLTNVILLQGIKESIDRDIGAVSSQLNWNSLGSSSTAESESQTNLQSPFTDAAYARKVFSTAGSRTRVNQTMKLGMLWDITSFDASPRTIREAGVHWGLTGTTNCHARVVSTDFILSTGDLFVVQINELQENGTL